MTAFTFLVPVLLAVFNTTPAIKPWKNQNIEPVQLPHLHFNFLDTRKEKEVATKDSGIFNCNFIKDWMTL